MIGNVHTGTGTACIKKISASFNDTQTDGQTYKVTLWIIVLLTLQFKNLFMSSLSLKVSFKINKNWKSVILKHQKEDS